MSTPTATGPGAKPYQLRHDPDGTSRTVRENLADILERELLGPADGDHELVSVSPDARYLLGRIAPVRLKNSKEAPSSAAAPEDPDQSGLELGDDHDAAESRGVPQVAVDDTAGAGDEDSGGDRDDEPVKRGLMIPASMGLRFQVPRDLEVFTVNTSWGVYNPAKSERTLPDGRRAPAYQRTPVDHRTEVRVSALRYDETNDFPLQDQVVLRIDVAEDTDEDRLLVELALCNDRETPRRIPVNAWLFQTQIGVDADGAEAFLPVRDALTDTRPEPDAELRRLALQYRDRLEFAIGRTCSADWTVRPRARRATQVRTTWLPRSETPQTRAVETPGAVLDMAKLAQADATLIDQGLRPIVDAYQAWLDDQQREAETLPDHLREDALELLQEARQVHAQLADGLDFLIGDVEAQRCFRFMNRVMADQRIQTQIAEHRAQDPDHDLAQAEAEVRGKESHPHSWRTFQLAFILMQLRSLCQPGTDRRSRDGFANVELLFFPTGGGKTEAYLGLAAFTFAIRRRQGVVESTDGPLDGQAGVAVLMRYTLRLLTSQQFERAAALVCAAELARAEQPEIWGTEPFRIGLWVGTNVSPKRVKDAANELKQFNQRNDYRQSGSGHRLTLLQVARCPWCGTEIDPRSISIDEVESRVRIWCSDEDAGCPFSKDARHPEGLPMLTVDEEIYRLAPAFVIATVDKFARLAREGEAAALFGYVAERCERHGYVHPDYDRCDIKDGSTHPARGGHPAAAKRPAGRLRPPDLIIQDELHLITGALGTTVGLFEVAIDLLSSWTGSDGTVVKPLIVASSATVRNAGDQIRGLYGRGATLFPPRVLDAANTFFSTDVPVSADSPGRSYIGVSTTGVRVTAAEIRIAQIVLAAGQELLDRSGAAADPYLTLVGYFNATRELAGMARYLQDDVQNAVARGLPGTGLARRSGSLGLAELTARVSSRDITQTLADMKVPFDPAFDTTLAKAERYAARRQKQRVHERETRPFDAVLATSMLQVGVDVTRLGLMLMVGQPKSTAEYIQASSRVGRDPSRPGLVITLGNWARPRDLAHYEQFRHYHQTFYAQVEPLSVTPFSVTSLERGLDGLLVSVARVLQAGSADRLSPERNAGKITDERSFVEALIDRLVERVRYASDAESANRARTRLINRLGHWERRRTALHGQANLSYEKELDSRQGVYRPLMRSAENLRSRDDALEEAPFVVANSMREVQPEINLLVSPLRERLYYEPPANAPSWAPQQGDTP